MLSRHYAPATSLMLVTHDTMATAVPDRRCGLLTSAKQPFSGHFDRIIELSDTEDLQTCAAKFFASMRSLDSSGLDVIIAHLFPDYGLGIALNDRLRRAACRD
jgi:L-threonylcarbamoyladenylate synthase